MGAISADGRTLDSLFKVHSTGDHERMGVPDPAGAKVGDVPIARPEQGRIRCFQEEGN
jgi:hypothetical protein